jgi:prepilin-type N-terminal cleavage/methylation domain-containing protein
MRTKGLTLIELILVVALIAILASIVVPRAGWGAMGIVQVKTTGRQFSDYLKLARSLAITHASSNSQGYKMVLSSSQPYTYSLSNAAPPFDVIKGPIALPPDVNCSGDKTFQFTPLGNLSVTQTLTVSFSKGGEATVVSVTSAGKITVQ